MNASWLLDLPTDGDETRTMAAFPALKAIPSTFEQFPQECLGACEREIANDPGADIPYMWAADCQWELGRLHEAVVALETGVRSSKRKTLLLVSLGKLKHKAGDAFGMAECFIAATRTQKKRPIDHQPYLYVAYIARGISRAEVQSIATRALRVSQEMGYDFESGFANSLMQLANTKRLEIADILTLVEWPQ